MEALPLIRAGTLMFHAIWGGLAVVCIRYAVVLSSMSLFVMGLKFGGAATVIVYFQGKYLDG
jgi:hypothetical protein